MNEVMFVTVQVNYYNFCHFIEKKVGMSICFFGHLKEEKYKWGQIDFH